MKLDHPLVDRFFEMQLMNRELKETEDRLVITEVRRCPKTGVRQRLNYTLDYLTAAHHTDLR